MGSRWMVTLVTKKTRSELIRQWSRTWSGDVGEGCHKLLQRSQNGTTSDRGLFSEPLSVRARMAALGSNALKAQGPIYTFCRQVSGHKEQLPCQDRLNRKDGFFRWASSLAAALSAAPLFSSAKAVSSSAAASEGEDYYAKLGVTPIINAA